MGGPFLPRFPLFALLGIASGANDLHRLLTIGKRSVSSQQADGSTVHTQGDAVNSSAVDKVSVERLHPPELFSFPHL